MSDYNDPDGDDDGPVGDVPEYTEPPEELVLKLRRPLTIGKGENAVSYETLTLHEPNGFQLDRSAREFTGAGQKMMLIHLITGVPFKAVQTIGQRDLQEASIYLDLFSVAGPKRGEIP
jgi:hypothetical protein